MKLWRLLAALCLALPLAAGPAQAAFDVGDLVCETTTTTGTGTVDLGGAVTNYVTFVSQIASGNTVPYHIRASDGKLEVGIGTFTDATPDTLSRTADWSTDGSGAELTLPAGTHNVCLGPISGSVAHNPMVENLDAGDFDITELDLLEVEDIELGVDATDTSIARTAAGRASIEGAQIELAGTQMIYIPAAAMISRATSGADCSATLDSGTSDLTMRVCNFDTAADEWAQFTLSMPPRWNEGTVTAQYVWSTTGASTPGETVSIDISCVAISDDDPLNATLGTPINVDDTMLSADGDSHLSAVSGAVTCGGTPAANDTVVFAVMRDISDDNVAADMSLIGVRLFITTDTANDG